jgi:hypothetical protein
MPMPEVARMNMMMSVVQKLLHSMSPANRLGFLQDGLDSRASRPTQCLGQNERPEVWDRREGPSQLARCRPQSKLSIGSWLIEKIQEPILLDGRPAATDISKIQEATKSPGPGRREEHYISHGRPISGHKAPREMSW